MSTETALNTTAKRLPTWVLSLLSISIISYVFALTAVAIFTEREVEFIPPKIGPGPKQAIISELSLLRQELGGLRADLVARTSAIDENLAMARTKAAETRQDHSVSVYLQWDTVVKEYENDKREIRESYLTKVKLLESKITQIESTLKQHIML